MEYCFESHTYRDVPINQMRFATYPGYVLQMIPSRPSVRLSRAPLVNNSTRATTQVHRWLRDSDGEWLFYGF